MESFKNTNVPSDYRDKKWQQKVTRALEKLKKPTGDYTLSNVSADRTFDPTATNLTEVAQVLGTLIEDLIAKGVLDE